MQEKIVIYQVLPRLYGNQQTANIPSGTLAQNGCGKLNDFTPEVLSRIRDFGFTHVWYTGVLEHATQTDYSAYGIHCDHPDIVKGKAGSPYAIKDYYDIDPDLAVRPECRMQEFESLVRRTHDAGLKFILDFVPNHVARQYHSDTRPDGVKDLGEDDDTTRPFAPDNNFYYIQGQPLHIRFADTHAAQKPYHEYPAKATGNDRFDAYPTSNDWYETVKLNYGVDYVSGRECHFSPVPNTWKKMTQILLFWAAKGIDAFRCDMAEMVPCEFWAYAIARVKKDFPEIRFIAEVYNPHEYRRYIHEGGFDYLYDKVGRYDTLRAVVCCQASASALTGCWQQVDDIRPHMLHFLENHDEQRIASPYFAGDARRALPALVVSACMDASPFMVYAGQELGETGGYAEGFSGLDGRTTIFDYWGVASLRKLCHYRPDALQPAESALYDYYRKIVKLCNDSSAIREGQFYDLMYANLDGAAAFNPHRHYAFLRHSPHETLLIVANFDESEATTGIRIPAHAFNTLSLRGGLHAAIDLISGQTQTLDLKPDAFAMVTTPGYGAVILKM